MGNFKPIPRYNVISMRVSDSEKSQLQQLAIQYDLSISDMMRQAMETYAGTSSGLKNSQAAH
jgi:predicted transcriptional regulator